MSFDSFSRSTPPTLTPVVPSSAASPGPAPATLALDTAATGLPCRVVSVGAGDLAPDWARWLAEIGFLPGERVMVTTRSVWGGDPLVVRVGQSTFALRRAEAACVRVEAL